MIKFGTIYDLENPFVRKKITKTIYVVIVTFVAILNMVLIPMAAVLLAFILELYWLLFGILFIPIGCLLTFVISKMLLLPFGRTIDIANIAINSGKIKNNVSDQKEQHESIKPKQEKMDKTKVQTENAKKKASDFSSAWECPKCGYKNPPNTTECENCYLKR